MMAESYRWLATLLELLLAEYDRERSLALIRDEQGRAAVAEILAPRLEAAGMPPGQLSTSAGDNLFLAVLGLRVKFSAEEARQKVALNIAMREGRA